MRKTETTPEERKRFYENRVAVLIDLDQVKDFGPKTEERKEAFAALSHSLTDFGGDLISLCANLARVTLAQGTVRMGPGRDAKERPMILSDVNILRAAIRSKLKAAGNEKETPEIIIMRRAMSRLTPVQLFYCAIYGGSFRYVEKTTDKNSVAVFTQRQRYFGGIPEKKLPTRTVEITKGNLTEKIINTVDLGIYPENAKRIYEILAELEKEQPVVELPVGKDEKNVVSRRVNRAGEAEFFLNHLPKGLKPWAEKTN